MSSGGECEGYVGVGWRIWELKMFFWFVVAVAYALYMRWF